MLAMRRGFLHQVLERLFVEDPAIDAAPVQFTKGEQRCEGQPAIPRPERKILQESEKEGGGFFPELRIGVTAEHRRLGTFHRVGQTKRRVDDTRLRVSPSELGGDGAMKLDQILAREVDGTVAVSR